MDSNNDKKTSAPIEGLSEAPNDIKKENAVICTPNDTEEKSDSFWDYDPYSKFSEMYPDDWERMMQRKSSEELKYDEERLCNELVLKCWIMDNPEKAKIWYTLFLNSRTDISAQDLDSFIKILGTDDIRERYLLSDKYCNFYTREAKADPWCQCHDGVYYHWKGWIEAYEEYQEFKSKAPQDWQRFVWSINAEDVMNAIDYDGLKMDEFIDYNYCRELGTYHAYELLKKWISDNKSLWEDIILNYKAGEKDDDTYLIQAWLDHFDRDDDFEVWKVKNPKLWWERRQWDGNRLSQEMVNLNMHYLDNSLFSLFWIKEYESTWNDWKEKNEKYWEECFETHKILLWYIYAESKWFTHQVKLEDEANEKFIKELTEQLIENGSSWEEIEEEINFFSSDSFYRKDWQYFAGIIFCDPREGIYCNEIEEHKQLVEKYYKELDENPEKKRFVEMYCSEEEKSLFFEAYYQYHHNEESPNRYADRKLGELWIETHQEQWYMWQHKFVWKKYYGNQVHYKICDYFDAWKRIHKEEWSLWVQEEFPKYKDMVKNVDIWYSWLADKDNAIIFENWAINNINDWEGAKDLARSYERRSICNSFGIDIEEYYDWRNRKTKEWDYWKDIIEEGLYIELFKKAGTPRTYTAEFELKLKIEELKYLASCGKSIFHDHLAIIEHNDKFGYINEQGNIVVDLQYDKVTDFKRGIAAVKINEYESKVYVEEMKRWFNCKYGGRWGIIDTNGKYLKQPQYDNLEFVNDDIILFSINGELDMDEHLVIGSKWGIMNYEMGIVTPARFSYLDLLDNGVVRASITEGEHRRWGLMTTEGKEITPFKYSYIFDSSSYYMLANINSAYVQTYKGDHWHFPKWDYCNGEWGYIDIYGNEVTSFESAYNEFDYKMRYPMTIDEECDDECYEENDSYDDELYTATSEDSHYSRYLGSYAQNEMGYSDEDIDTIFDGDPSAYWNID